MNPQPARSSGKLRRARPHRTQTPEPGTGLPDELLAELSHLSDAEIAEISCAYQFSAEAHTGQLRLSGEPYISHPMQVAKTIAELKLDKATIIAGLLHDVLEDTTVTKQELAGKFDAEVVEIVDGVSKIEHLEFGGWEVKRAESFQKMLLAVTRDLRVILVKLADRLHNMRTLRHKSLEKRRRTARETLEIYAPIARRLGIEKLRSELEEHGFAALYPMRHRILSKALEEKIGRRSRLMDRACDHIGEQLERVGIEHEISSRRKNIYSVYRKMCEKKLPFAEVLDIFAVRIITATVDDCYRVLGQVHNLYRPKPGFFKDYIAIPKPNGYQSLHTVLIDDSGTPLEVQVRTREMNLVAERGIAAHVSYKTTGNDTSVVSEHVKAREWIQGLVDMHRGSAGSSKDFFENFRISLFSDEVYVFTPEADIIALPRSATALDFAFSVHTDLGLGATTALVDKQLCPLSQELKTGQTIEIITSSRARPSPGWLDFVVTPKARLAVRHHLRTLHDDAAVKLGKSLLDEALQDYAAGLDQVDESRVSNLINELGLESAHELYKQIGMGEQVSSIIARYLLGSEDFNSKGSGRKRPAINGTEGLMVSYAKCCYPIPGDSIVGIMTPGKGLVIHRNECANISNRSRRKDVNRLFLEWSATQPEDAEYHAMIRVTAQHKRGMLAVVAGKIAEMGSNIENIKLDDHAGAIATMMFTISVRNRGHLAKIMRRLHNASRHIRIMRVR